MLRQKAVYLILTGMLLTIMACKASDGILATPTYNLGPYRTQTAQAALTLVPTSVPVDSTATVNAEQTARAQGTLEALTATQAILNAQASATAELQSQSTLNANATRTQAAASRITATAYVLQIATDQARDMLAQLERLVADGVIPNTQGEYVTVDDFDQSWAQLGWYRYWPVNDRDLTNFAITANVSWDSASDKANWPEAGCGFVFGEQEGKSHDLVYLGLDGTVYLASNRNGDWRMLSSRRYGNLSVPAGEARFILAVMGKRITFYVNDTKVISANDSLLASGQLNFTLLSGTNKGFGTRCQMTKVGLWIFQ